MSVWSFWSFSSGDGSAQYTQQSANNPEISSCYAPFRTNCPSCNPVMSNMNLFSFLLSSPAASLVCVWVFRASTLKGEERLWSSDLMRFAHVALPPVVHSPGSGLLLRLSGFLLFKLFLLSLFSLLLFLYSDFFLVVWLLGWFLRLCVMKTEKLFWETATFN